MAHILLIKRDPTTGRLCALCHRRGRHIREPFHWGIPGGAFDREERYILFSMPGSNSELKSLAYRRAAIRETIEECGGGYHPLCPPLPAVPVGAINQGGMRYKNEVIFRHITIPPGILNIMSDTKSYRVMNVPYGSSKDKITKVFVYVLDTDVDAAFFSGWQPRAMKPFRSEIDETYTLDKCEYGQTWIELESILQQPTRPTAGTSMPFCEFLVNLFTDMADELRFNIRDIEAGQLANRSEKLLQNTSFETFSSSECLEQAEHLRPPQHFSFEKDNDSDNNEVQAGTEECPQVEIKAFAVLADDVHTPTTRMFREDTTAESY